MSVFPWLLSFSVGFLSLSQEILWMRVVGFAMHSLPFAFSVVLALYLVGIAVGAWCGKRLCERSGDLYATSGVVLLAAGIFDLALMPVLAAGFDVGVWSALGAVFCALAIVLTAGLKSVMFPVAHHLGSQHSGPLLARSVSRVYLCNILGSTLGPLVTSYALLDHLGVQGCMTLVGLGALALGAACMTKAHRPSLAGSFVALVLVLAWVVPLDDSSFVRRAADRYADNPADPIHILENRHGIIHVIPDGKAGDVIFGRNAYDGRVSADVGFAQSGLERAVVALAAHSAPKRVLIVGMSTGAWTRIVTASPLVQEIDVVEINPGYLDIIRRYPHIAPIEKDPRVHIHIDDGRRWLRRNPNKKYDLVIQNTTLHWLGNVTNLVSKEYMVMIRSRLLPGGILALNTTGSDSIRLTMASVFAATRRVGSFMYGFQSGVPLADGLAMQRAKALVLDGKPLLSPDLFEDGKLMDRSMKKLFATGEAEHFGHPKHPLLVTEQNMDTEYLSGRVYKAFHFLLDPIAAWRASRQNPHDSGIPG